MTLADLTTLRNSRVGHYQGRVVAAGARPKGQQPEARGRGWRPRWECGSSICILHSRCSVH